MNWFFAEIDLSDLMEELRQIKAALELTVKLLEASQGNLQYYIGGAVAMFMASGLGILWRAYQGEKQSNEDKEERQQKRHEEQIQKLVADLRASTQETITALNEKAETAKEAANLVSENTAAITALKTTIDELIRSMRQPGPGAPPIGGA